MDSVSLTARPRAAATLSDTPGEPIRRRAAAEAPGRRTSVHRIPLPGRPAALLRVPVSRAASRAARPAPFAVVLHGAGGHAAQAIDLLEPHASAAGVMLLAPESVGATWDVVHGRAGFDIESIDQAMHWVFEREPVDPQRLAMMGFSDGATCALSVGLANGNLFTHVAALAPGFVADFQLTGVPMIFVAHGTRDAVLPIGHCSRRIVPVLERVGYPVEYLEFDGGHEVPSWVASAAVAHLVRDARP